MSWLKLTISKGKRKKRAHKKFLKRADIAAYFKAVELKVTEAINASDIQERLDKYSYEMLIYGRSTVEFPDGTTKEYGMIPEDQRGHDFLANFGCRVGDMTV